MIAEAQRRNLMAPRVNRTLVEGSRDQHKSHEACSIRASTVIARSASSALYVLQNVQGRCSAVQDVEILPLDQQRKKHVPAMKATSVKFGFIGRPSFTLAIRYCLKRYENKSCGRILNLRLSKVWSFRTASIATLITKKVTNLAIGLVKKRVSAQNFDKRWNTGPTTRIMLHWLENLRATLHAMTHFSVTSLQFDVKVVCFWSQFMKQCGFN